MIKIIILFLFVSSSAALSQNLKIIPYDDGFAFYVDKKKYTLPEFDLIVFRVWDENNHCESGGEGNFESYYEPTFITHRKGRYEIVIYIKPNRILIKEKVEVR